MNWGGCLLLLQEWALDYMPCHAVLQWCSWQGLSGSCSISVTLGIPWCRFGANLAALCCTASSLSTSFCAAGVHTVHEYSRMARTRDLWARAFMLVPRSSSYAWGSPASCLPWRNSIDMLVELVLQREAKVLSRVFQHFVVALVLVTTGSRPAA